MAHFRGIYEPRRAGVLDMINFMYNDYVQYDMPFIRLNRAFHRHSRHSEDILLSKA